MKHSLTLTLVSVACLAASTARAQDETKTPSFLAYVPAGFENVVHVADPLPQLQRLLTSKTLRDAITKGPLGAALRDAEILPPGLDPQFIAPLVLALQDQIPTALTAAIPEDTVASFGFVYRLFQAGTLAHAAHTVEAAEERSTFAAQAIDALERITPPRLVVRLSTRKAATATEWFEGLRDSIIPLGEVPGIEVEAEPTRVSVQVEPIALVYRSTDWKRLASAVFGDRETPLEKRARRALAGLSTQASVAVEGNNLVLRIGDTDGTPRATAASLGPLFSASEDQWLFVRWDQSRFQAQIESMLTSLENAQDTAAMKYLFETDAGLRLGLVYDELESQMTEMLEQAPRGAGRLDILAGGARWQTRTPLEDDEDEEDYDTLSQIPLSPWIPDDVGLVASNAWMTLDAASYYLLLDAMYVVEESYDRAEDDATIEALERVIDFLWDDLESLSEYIGGEDSEVFEWGTLALAESGAMLESVALVRADDTLSTLAPKTRLPAVAVVAMPSNPGGGIAFVERSYRELLGAFVELDEDAAVSAPIDLGLGVATRELLLAGTPALPDGAALRAVGDFRPHFFEHEGFLVVSTSVDLSRRALASFQQDRRPNPDNDDKGWVLATSGAAFRDLFRSLGASFRLFSADPGRAFVSSAKLPPLVELGQAPALIDVVGEVFGLIDTIRWEGSLDGREIVERLSIGW